MPCDRGKGPGGVLRGRADGHGRELRCSVEAPWLGGVDVTGKGGSVFSFCARLGVVLPWAGRDGLPLEGCSCGVSMARAEGYVAGAGRSERGRRSTKNLEFLLHVWLG